MKDKLLIKFKGQNSILYYNFLFSANAISPMQTLKMVVQPHLILLNIC